MNSETSVLASHIPYGCADGCSHYSHLALSLPKRVISALTYLMPSQNSLGNEEPLETRKKSVIRRPGAQKSPRTATPLEQSLGDALRRLRLRERVSVRTLASKCGFSPSFISQVELNQASPSLASLERIAAGNRRDIRRFLSRSDNRVLYCSIVSSPYVSEWMFRSQIESNKLLASEAD